MKYLSTPESSEDQDQAVYYTLDDLRNKEEEYSPPADEEDGHLYLLHKDWAQLTVVTESDTPLPAVTKLLLSSDHIIHPVTWSGDCWVTSAEVSSLISQWLGYDLLAKMLERKKASDRVSIFK